MRWHRGHSRLSLVLGVCAAAVAACTRDDAPVGPARVLTTVRVSVADTSAELGQFTVATATILDQFGATFDAGRVMFASSSPEVAGVNPTDGRILAISPGTTTITASLRGKSGSQVITVSFPPLFLNEVVPNGDGAGGWVELFNPTDAPVDLTGWTITNGNIFQSNALPVGAVIPARGFFVIEESSIAGGLQARDAVHLFSSFGVQSDAFIWGHDPVTSFGRCPDEVGGFIRTTEATKGTANACP